jgi:alpha-beta hydrolase superfamily lysophospholipase
MQSSEFFFKDTHGVDVHVHKWLPDGPARAVIQVSHGMQEPAYRYEAFARDMTAAGFAVYANDHRGHGKTIIGGIRGKLGEGGWQAVLSAMTQLTAQIRDENPGLKVFLLGHSWGSFLTQAYIQSFGDRIDGCILSGTNGKNPLVGVGAMVAQAVNCARGGDTKADLLWKLSLGPYNNGLHDSDTGLDWLSRDKNVVRAYFDDPECGADFPNSFYLEMLKLLKTIWQPAHEKRIPEGLPIYIFAGAADPVGLYGKGVRALCDRYRKYGVADVSLRLFDGGRHEMLNEINRDEVIDELKKWLEAHM